MKKTKKARADWLDAYGKVLNGLSQYEGMHVNLDSEYAREAIAANITDGLLGRLKCCEEQAKALKDREDFFEDTKDN